MSSKQVVTLNGADMGVCTMRQCLEILKGNVDCVNMSTVLSTITYTGSFAIEMQLVYDAVGFAKVDGGQELCRIKELSSLGAC